MNARERVLTALSHRQPDRMAVDFGGTVVTNMHVSIVEALRKHYGLEQKPVTVLEPYTMIGVVDHDLQDCLGSDVTMATGRVNAHGYVRGETKLWTTPQGQQVLVPVDFAVKDDGRGGLHIYPQGDITVPPSGHMPKGGFYFDAIERGEGFDPDNLHPEDNLEEWSVLTQKDLDYIKEQVDRHYASGKAVAFAPPGMGLGDVADIPGCGLGRPKGIRTVQDWYMAPLLWPEYVEEVFARQMDIALQNLKLLWETVGDKIQVVHTCGTDLAHQEGTFMSVDLFRELYLPHYKKVNGWIHENTTWKIFKHSCGAVAPFIPSLIEAGFDILNPVQCSANGMDPAWLKTEYGRDITFWGGGVDTQKTLPFGTPDEVRGEVLGRCEIFAKDGGFVFNTIHNIQPGVPTENIIAMINAINDFNGVTQNASA